MQTGQVLLTTLAFSNEALSTATCLALADYMQYIVKEAPMATELSDGNPQSFYTPLRIKIHATPEGLVSEICIDPGTGGSFVDQAFL
jgi:hypothetical protein